MTQQLETMFRLQEQLNDDTNGPTWREGWTRQGKRINWRRCIVMETAELIDSFPWKHWKGIAGDLDRENIRIEMVDIWHFVMSLVLMRHDPREGAALAAACFVDQEARLPAAWSPREDARLDGLLAPYERLMALALEGESVEALLEAFWRALGWSGMDLEALYRLYIGKNALNQFRQKHGYKEGRYRKIWQGREDNAVMQAVLEEEPAIGYDALMERLERLYREA